MKSQQKQKLELTWIGKGDEPKLEPRILIEQPEYSYGDTSTGNMLIQGDNLLALKALEQDFAGKIKCIYIDPPFNTGAAFEHYDDGVEHSLWLDLMYRRLLILRGLLNINGCIFIHLDDNEVDYCRVLLDEVFGRDNFINRITLEARSPSAFSTVNPGVFKSSEYLLWYARKKDVWESRSMRIPSSRDTAYNKFITNKTAPVDSWKITSLRYAFLEDLNEDRLESIRKFVYQLFNERMKLLDKHEVANFLLENYEYSQVVRLNTVASYIFVKLCSVGDFDVFYDYVYYYLLERSSIMYRESDFDDFVYKNADSVVREGEISDSGAGRDIVDIKYLSLDNQNKIFLLRRAGGLDDVYVMNGKQLLFYSKNVSIVDDERIATKLLTNIWGDISWEGIASEGGIKFKKGKKPECLIKRCFELSTNEGDIILDSFLGSGTTAAVAHKMGRRYIGIELGDHAKTHCQPRLKKVVDGTDQGGISKAVGWQGGGGFRFYTLAPSLLNRDKYGNWIISKEYNPDMLAAAMAKQEGFRYQPDEAVYWKQGRSSEKDFLFTTTAFLTVAMLDGIHDEMQPEESLLVACKAFQKECLNRHANISIKKIPHMLLGRCEFGREDYSLNIVQVPCEEQPDEALEEPEEIPGEASQEPPAQTNLFE